MQPTNRGTLKATGIHPWQMLAFFSMAILYLFFYFCRSNLGVATPEIREAFGLDRKVFGQVVTLFMLVYAAGQFINGFLADRYGPKRIMVIGALGSVAACVCFGLSGKIGAFLGLPRLMWLPVVNFGLKSVTVDLRMLPSEMLLFLVFWGINAYFQSCGVAPGSRILFNWFPEKRWATWFGVYNALCYSGGAIVSAVAGFAIFRWGWPAAFFLPPAFLAVMAVVFLWLGKGKPQDVGLQPEWEEKPQNTPRRRVGGREYWQALTHPRLMLCYLIGFGQKFVRWGILSWIFDLLKTPLAGVDAGHRGFGMHTVVAGVIGSMAMWGGAAFSLLVGPLSDRYFKGSRWQVLVLSFALTALPLLWIAQGPKAFGGPVLFQFTTEVKAPAETPAAKPAATTAAAGATEPAATAPASQGMRIETVKVTVGWVLLGLAVFIAGGLIQAVETPLFALPGDILGTEKAGTGVGILDGWMYLGAAFSGIYLGSILDLYGLGGIYLLAAVAGACTLLSLLVRK